MASVILRGKLWKIIDLLSRLDCRTCTRQYTSLQTLFLVSVLLIYGLEHMKHMGTCAIVILVSCLCTYVYYENCQGTKSINQSKKLICNSFNDHFSHLLSKHQTSSGSNFSDDLLLFSVLYLCKLNIFGFPIVDIRRRH